MYQSGRIDAHSLDGDTMSLYSYGFQLLPRPPRDVFSSGSETTRATLPDFANVAELSRFVDSLFVPHWKVHGIGPQVVVTTTFIFLILVIVGLILARRIYEGKFWLVRVIRRSSGVIVVPNPIVTFLLTAGLFGSIFFPFFLSLCHRTIHHTPTSPTGNVVLWITLPCILVIYGIIWATIGTYYATPDTSFYISEEDEEDSIRWPLRLLGNAKVINAMTLFVPVLATIAIAIPSFITHSIWGEALHLEKTWQSKYVDFTSFTQEMVQESQIIWYTRLKAAKVGTIVFILYTIIAFAMIMAYVPTAIRLAVAVRREIQGVKRHLDALQSTQHQEQSTVQVSRIIREALEANASPSLRGGGPGGPSRSDSNSSMTAKDHRLHRQQAGWSSPESSHLRNASQLAHEGKESFTATRKHTENLLESALRHIYIQAIAISLGTLGLGGISLALSLTLYGKMEQSSQDGGTLFEHHVGPIWLALLYISCVFGGLSVFAVAYKTYEPVFVSLSSATSNQNQSTATHIGFKDVIMGLEHIRSTFFSSVKVKDQIGSSAALPVEEHNYPATGRRRATTILYTSPCDTIIEEKTYLASKLQSGKEAASSWDIEPYRLASSSGDSSVGSSSPYSVFKHLRS